ncbi:MAG TPA: cytochrome c oxidase subunit II [Thermoleophilaceae bacterium]|nr:cytochrome c oxidase subunit II [Thermoleophilaceae bacterium]
MSEREPIAQDSAKGPPETDPRIEGEKHPVARMMAIGVIASLVGIGISLLIDWFPADGSSAARDIDTLYDVLLICSVPVFVLVMTIAIYSVVRFRAKPGDMGDGPPIHGNTKLEIIWVTVPFIMVTALAIYGWIVLDDIEASQPDELVVKVTGQQFAWTFEYPEEEVNASELVLPVDRPVDFRITTKDVIHSFWVPQFRLKSDAVPGLTTRVRVTPDRTGDWEVVCTELCGLGHSTMRAFVRVVPEDDYDAWIAEQGRQAEGGGAAGGGGGSGGSGGGGGRTAGAEGEQVFTATGCGSCHTLAAANAEGTVGPDLDNIERANAAFIKQSITDPGAVVTEGFGDGIMPQDYGQQLSDAELDALVKYLLEAQQ